MTKKGTDLVEGEDAEILEDGQVRVRSGGMCTHNIPGLDIHATMRGVGNAIDGYLYLSRAFGSRLSPYGLGDLLDWNNRSEEIGGRGERHDAGLG
jgi:hypothetical protein